MARNSGVAVADVEVVTKGDVPQSAVAQARRLVSQVARHTDQPVLHARVKLTHDAGVRAHESSVTVQANINLNGRLMRAQVAAPSEQEGINLLGAVLRHRIQRFAAHWEARRGGVPSDEPHEWRHASEGEHRPMYYPRPPRERRVVRHKAFELTSCTPDEAIEDLELMGYDFQLFTDVQSQQDSVVYRRDSTGYRIAQLEPHPGTRWVTAEPVTLSPLPAPELDEHEAIERFNLIDMPFLFFRERASGRGHVIYRRYDGHYGLVTPAG